jgi:hypothetical protein
LKELKNGKYEMLNSVNHLLITIPVNNASEGFPCAKVTVFCDICKDPDDFNISINENKKSPLVITNRLSLK